MKDPDIRKAEDLYQAKLKALLEPAHKGEFVAIHPETGEFFLGTEALEVFQKASAKYPGRPLVLKRVGYPAARFIGSR